MKVPNVYTVRTNVNTSYLNEVLSMLQSRKEVNFMPLDFYTGFIAHFAPQGVMFVGLTAPDYDAVSPWEP